MASIISFVFIGFPASAMTLAAASRALVFFGFSAFGSFALAGFFAASGSAVGDSGGFASVFSSGGGQEFFRWQRRSCPSCSCSAVIACLPDEPGCIVNQIDAAVGVDRSAGAKVSLDHGRRYGLAADFGQKCGEVGDGQRREAQRRLGFSLFHSMNSALDAFGRDSDRVTGERCLSSWPGQQPFPPAPRQRLPRPTGPVSRYP